MADFMRGEELKRLREANSLSQEELAGKLGVTTKTVRSWEKGGSIRPANARTVGSYFKVDPAQLVLHEINGADPSDLEDESQLDRIERMLTAIFNALGLQHEAPGEKQPFPALPELPPIAGSSDQTTGQPQTQNPKRRRKPA